MRRSNKVSFVVVSDPLGIVTFIARLMLGVFFRRRFHAQFLGFLFMFSLPRPSAAFEGRMSCGYIAGGGGGGGGLSCI